MKAPTGRGLVVADGEIAMQADLDVYASGETPWWFSGSALGARRRSTARRRQHDRFEQLE